MKKKKKNWYSPGGPSGEEKNNTWEIMINRALLGIFREVFAHPPSNGFTLANNSKKRSKPCRTCGGENIKLKKKI